MKINRCLFTVVAVATVATLVAQVPVATVDPHRHGNLAAAQENIRQAFNNISESQTENNDRLGGHAGKAKELLRQANDEITAAANVANISEADGPGASSANGPFPSGDAPPPSTPNIAGSWTIYAYNTSQPGSSLKQVQLTQAGNIISGSFHGPHQHGKLQGWITGNHVEFSTDTRDVLTFRGEITATGMSGLYGVHGQHAPWNAERSN